MRCNECGEEAITLTNGLCDKCYVRQNEGPCGCFERLERFE